ncbi:hypothetical protein [Nocardioides sp. NPDC047086]|uniref:hypothetical protein n=1 Tax=Nocardioides sp. NPDC047086 TaxID=3154810 RepID=UPI0033C99236
MNVQIIRSEVERSARSIKSAADQVAKIDFGSPLVKIARALAGGVSPGAANGFKGEWKADQDRWVRAANGHHARTLDDANRIVETDDTVAHRGSGQVNALNQDGATHLPRRMGGPL